MFKLSYDATLADKPTSGIAFSSDPIKPFSNYYT